MRLPFLLRALLRHPHHPYAKAPRQESTMAAAAAPVPEVESMLAKVALECGGDISASQEEILAGSSFLGGDNALPASASDEEEEVFATPFDATQQEEPIVMCTLPFTPSPSQPRSPAPPSAAAAADDDVAPGTSRRKPRVCIRKVRGARIGTPTPSPKQQPEQQQQQAEQQPQPEQQPRPEQQQQRHVDPLVRAVLMIPTRKTTTATTTTTSKQNALEDFIALARLKGLI